MFINFVHFKIDLNLIFSINQNLILSHLKFFYNILNFLKNDFN
jgi:hypothetical protein